MLALPMLTVACGQSAEVGYRMTVEVDDNGVARSGSGVWRLWLEKPLVPLASPSDGKFEGDAIPVVLPGRGVLLMLPAGLHRNSGETATLLLWDVFGSRVGARKLNMAEDLLRIAKLRNVGATVHCRYDAVKSTEPILEYLPNSSQAEEQCLKFGFSEFPARPESFLAVHTWDAKSMPRGVTVRRVTIQITSDPLTRELDRYLPWVSDTAHKDR